MCIWCFKNSKQSSEDNGHELEPPRIVEQNPQGQIQASNVAADLSLRAEPQNDSNAPIPFLANGALYQSEQSSTTRIPELANVSSNTTTNSHTTAAHIKPIPSTVDVETKPNTNAAGPVPNLTAADMEINSSTNAVPVDPVSKSSYFESLWREAYKKLENDDPSLVRDLETIIKEASGLDQSSDIKSKMQTIIDLQKTKMESKQWSFHALGKEIKVREKVNAIFSLVTQSKDLIAAGMTFAPVYISIPWTAVSSLIPLIMKDSEQHKAAIDGLERVARILWCYTIVEEGLLPDPSSTSTYRTAVFDLYVNILRYQALAARYFGKSIVKRVWGNTTTATLWSDISSKIVALDDDCRRCVSFLGFKAQQYGTFELMTTLEKHSNSLARILENTDNERYEKIRVLEWISIIGYGADHDTVRESLGDSYLNTGRWLFNHAGFKKWQSSSSGVFLLKGTAGTGKSALTSIVIQDFIDTPSAYLAYFYCSRKEKTTRRSDTTMIIRSLVKCLSVSGHPAFKTFLEDYRNSESQRAGGCELQLKKSISLLRESFAANPAKSIVLIVDAIDECVDPDGLLKALKEIWESGQQNLRLFLSSRLNVDFKAKFPTVIEADIGLSNIDDIRYYLQTEIPSRISDQIDPVITVNQAMELEDVLIKYANGMFQWITLEVEIFLGPDIMFQETIDEKIEALKQEDIKPIDQLNIAYEQIYLSAIGNSDPNRKLVVETALQWMLYGYTEFRIEELALMASIKPDGTALRPFPPDRLLRICSNFMVENSNGVLRLAHLTIRPYLESRQITDNPFSPPIANLRAALTCVRFLGSSEESHSLHGFHKANTVAYRNIRTYSTKYWTLHSRDAKNNDETPPELLFLIKGLYKNSLPSSPIHMAIRYRQAGAIEYGIATGANIDVKNSFRNTPLQEAVRWRSLNILTLLLASGAAVDSKNIVGDTALHIASRLGFASFAEVLLRHDANTDIINYHGFAPLHVSVHYGQFQILQILLQFGANIDQKDFRGNTALHYASMTSQEDIVAILIGAGCKKQLTNADGETPWTLAGRNQAAEIQALLQSDHTNVRRQSTDHGRAVGTEKQQPIRPKDVSFDISGLCPQCDLNHWYKSAIQGLSDNFYSSYKELLESANNGCRMCEVFVQEVNALDLGSDYLNTLTSTITVQMILSSATPLKALVQDLLVVSMGNNVRLVFELCIDRTLEDKFGHIFNGRTIDIKSGSKECLTLARNWLKQCESQHSEYKKDFELPELPARVINIQDIAHPFLIEQSSQNKSRKRGKYAVLSSVWGITKMPVTKTGSIEFYKTKLDIGQFPQSFRDLIELASNLDIQYIWIKDLCIIRNSAYDEEYEMRAMARYFENATCVIATVGSEGPFDRRRASLVSILKIPIFTGDTTGAGYVHLRKTLTGSRQRIHSYLRNPFWEATSLLLAKCVLYCYEDEFIWNCATCLISEGNILAQKPIFQLKIQTLPIASTIATASNNPLHSWYFLIESFSGAGPFGIQHVLYYMTRIAATFKDRSGCSIRLSYGIWKDDLWRGLLWRTRRLAQVEYSTSWAPTWSWTSMGHSISYNLAMSIHSSPIGDDFDARVMEIHTVDLNDVTADLLSRIRVPTTLKVSAISLQLASVDLSLNCECFFDWLKDEIDWIDHGSDTHFVAILLCKWYSDSSEVGSRWLGLILKPAISSDCEANERSSSGGSSMSESGSAISESTTDDSSANDAALSKLFVRVGLFMGPQNGVSLVEWERREFDIV